MDNLLHQLGVALSQDSSTEVDVVLEAHPDVASEGYGYGGHGDLMPSKGAYAPSPVLRQQIEAVEEGLRRRQKTGSPDHDELDVQRFGDYPPLSQHLTDVDHPRVVDLMLRLDFGLHHVSTPPLYHAEGVEEDLTRRMGHPSIHRPHIQRHHLSPEAASLPHQLIPALRWDAHPASTGGEVYDDIHLLPDAADILPQNRVGVAAPGLTGLRVLGVEMNYGGPSLDASDSLLNDLIDGAGDVGGISLRDVFTPSYGRRYD